MFLGCFFLILHKMSVKHPKWVLTSCLYREQKKKIPELTPPAWHLLFQYSLQYLICIGHQHLICIRWGTQQSSYAPDPFSTVLCKDCFTIFVCLSCSSASQHFNHVEKLPPASEFLWLLGNLVEWQSQVLHQVTSSSASAASNSPSILWTSLSRPLLQLKKQNISISVSIPC